MEPHAAAARPENPRQPRAPESYFKATEPQLAVRTWRENGVGSSPSTPGAPAQVSPQAQTLLYAPGLGGAPLGRRRAPSSPPAVQESSRESSGRGQAPPPPRRAHFAHPLSGPRPCLQRPCVCRTDCIEL